MPARKKYTDAQMEYLRVGYKKMKVEELTDAFNREFGYNRTVPAIKSIMHKNGIRCGRKHAERFIDYVSRGGNMPDTAFEHAAVAGERWRKMIEDINSGVRAVPVLKIRDGVAA